MNFYEHWTRVTRFNPLWVSGLTSCSLGLSKQQHCTCIMLFFLHTFKPSNFAISVGREQKATTSVYFSEIRNSLLEFNSRKGRQHLTKWRANKFKIARIHSLSDVFAAVSGCQRERNPHNSPAQILPPRLPRTQTSLFKPCAQRKAGRSACRLYPSWSLAVHHQSLVSRSPLPCEKRSAWGGGCLQG